MIASLSEMSKEASELSSKALDVLKDCCAEEKEWFEGFESFVSEHHNGGSPGDLTEEAFIEARGQYSEQKLAQDNAQYEKDHSYERVINTGIGPVDRVLNAPFSFIHAVKGLKEGIEEEQAEKLEEQLREGGFIGELGEITKKGFAALGMEDFYPDYHQPSNHSSDEKGANADMAAAMEAAQGVIQDMAGHGVGAGECAKGSSVKADPGAAVGHGTSQGVQGP